jgi:hypothetical protein
MFENRLIGFWWQIGNKAMNLKRDAQFLPTDGILQRRSKSWRIFGPLFGLNKKFFWLNLQLQKTFWRNEIGFLVGLALLVVDFVVLLVLGPDSSFLLGPDFSCVLLVLGPDLSSILLVLGPDPSPFCLPSNSRICFSYRSLSSLAFCSKG